MWQRHELSVLQMQGQGDRLRMNGFKLIAPFRDPTIVTLGKQQDLKKFFSLMSPCYLDALFAA